MSVRFNFKKAAPRDAYRVLSSLVIPRPIAWVTTLGPGKIVNLAPFSSFMGTSNPPIVTLALGRRRDGTPKDTYRNIAENGEAVVHIGDAPLLEAMHATGEEIPPEESEVERLGMKVVKSEKVKVPRLIEAPVALECRFREEHPMGEGSTFVMLDILFAHVSEAAWDDEVRCAVSDRWSPIARLGSVAGPNYGLLGELFTLGKSELPKHVK